MYNKLRLFAVIMLLLLAMFTILNRHHVVEVLTLNNSLLKPKWNQIIETRKDVLLNRNQHVADLENKYTLDWDYKLKLSPWSYPRKWVSTTHVAPENTPELGAVLREMATRRIVSADIGTHGKEFKIEVVLEGEQRVIFQPSGCLGADTGHAVEDRNSGEVVAFHLGRNTRGKNYCFNSMFTEGRLLLDIVDTAVVEFIAANIDRQDCFKLGNQHSSAMLIYDTHRIDFNLERNQLQPLRQCCRIRHSTWLQLLMHANGALSTILRSVLSKDPTAPVASREFLNAMDIRLTYTINTVKTCISKFNVHSVLVKDD